MRGSRLAIATTSRCSSSDATPSIARQQRRDDDDGPGFFGDAVEQLEPRQRLGLDETAGELLHERNRELARRNHEQQRRRDEHRGDAPYSDA